MAVQMDRLHQVRATARTQSITASRRITGCKKSCNPAEILLLQAGDDLNLMLVTSQCRHLA